MIWVLLVEMNETITGVGGPIRGKLVCLQLPGEASQDRSCWGHVGVNRLQHTYLIRDEEDTAAAAALSPVSGCFSAHDGNLTTHCISC